MKLKELMDCSAKAKMLKEALAKDSNKELIEEIARALCYEVWGSYEYVEQFKNQAEAIIPIVEAVKKAERERIVKEIETMKLPYVPQRSVDNIQEACRREIKYAIKTGGE